MATHCTIDTRRTPNAEHFFWEGRAGSLENQALGPIANPIEMGNTHHPMVKTLSRISGYAPYSKEAFGTPEITPRNLTEAEIDALVVLMPALEGQGYEDTPPASFPQ